MQSAQKKLKKYVLTAQKLFVEKQRDATANSLSLQYLEGDFDGLLTAYYLIFPEARTEKNHFNWCK